MIEIVWKSSDRPTSASASSNSGPQTSGTSTSSPSTNSHNGSSSSGLSIGAIIALGVAIPLGVIALIVLLLWYRKRRQRRVRDDRDREPHRPTPYRDANAGWPVAEKRAPAELPNSQQPPELPTKRVHEIDGIHEADGGDYGRMVYS